MRTWNVLLVGGAVAAMAVTAYGQAPKTRTAIHQQNHASVHQQTYMSPDQQSALVDRYCSDCHNPDTKSGGMTLTDLDFKHPAAKSDWLAEEVIRKVTVGMMPPPGRQRPDPATLKLFAASLAHDIDTYAMAHPNPGDPPLHRLNRVEYQNSVHELLGVNVDASELLPPDDMDHSFDNMADVLTLSPTLMQAYVRAAGEISRDALGDRNAVAQGSTYVVPLVVSQVRHVDGAPIGTRGGISVIHDFPADGLYTFQVSFYFSNVGFLFGTTQGKTQYIEISVNGERVAVIPIDPASTEDDRFRTPPIAVKAGPQRVSAAFLQTADGPVQDAVQPTGFALLNLMQAQVSGLTTLPHVESFTITGPTQVTGISETPSRKLIFSCYPKDAAQETPCATKIVARLATQAYRRPVTPQEMAGLMKLYALGYNSDNGGFEGGVGVAIQAILASPQFIYRFEHNRPLVKAASAAVPSLYPISDTELASRLSYFLWSAAPDATLLDLAKRNQLHQPQVLTAQVHRMLLDPRSFALSTNFAREWLHLQNMQSVQPDPYLFPNYDKNLGNAMVMETELFFNSVVHDDASVLTLLDGHYTFVNQQLAQLYGIPDVLGSRFRRVELTDPNRFGLLGQASILTLTSASNRTSPTIRGKYVMEVLLGTPPPPPPPIVPALEEATAGVGAHIPTVRERLEEHRKNPTCAACHSMMDPIGFALENYNPIGAWRTFDSGQPIDAAGKLFFGTAVNSPADLRKALMTHSDSFIDTFTENLFAYGMGRVLRPIDMPVIRSIEREAAAHNDDFSAFVLGIVNSEPFRMRSPEPLSNHLLATIDTTKDSAPKAAAQQ